jgi:hypothetical protein
VGHFDQLVLTIPSAFFTGAALAISLFACILSIGLYFVYKKVVLLYFPAVVATTTLAVVYSHGHSPGILSHQDVNENIAIANILLGIATYAFYRLFLGTIPNDKVKAATVRSLKVTLLGALLSRAVFIFYHPPFMDIAASFFTVLFFTHCVAVAVFTYKTKTWASRFCRLACITFASGPILASIISHLPIELASIEGRLIFIVASSSLSIIWVFALIALSIEEHEEFKLEKLRELANAYMRIRHFMNTPLQTITWSIDLLKAAPEQPKETIDNIESALVDLRAMNRILSMHEKNIDWRGDL